MSNNVSSGHVIILMMFWLVLLIVVGFSFGYKLADRGGEECYHVTVVDKGIVLFEEISKNIEVNYKEDGFVIYVRPKYIWDENWYSHGFSGGDEVVKLEKVRVKKINP